jgi:putative ABC transport system substrate-binding protein
MIDRRTVLCGSGAALACLAGSAQAQKAGKPWRVAYLSFRRGPNEFEQAFQRGLRERGLVEGGNLVVDYRWSGFDAARHRANVAELMGLQPNLVVAVDGSGTRAMSREINPEVPIVAPAMGDPITQGISRSLARPDDNMTGISVFATELAAKRLELLKEAVPDLRCAGAVFNGKRPSPPLGVAITVETGKARNIDVLEMPIALPDGIDAAFVAAARQGVQGLAIVSDTATIEFRSPLCDRSQAHRLPTIFANRTYLRAGGLMSYGPDLEGAFQRSAYFVERILKGVKPAELPIEQTSEFHLTLNLRTARAMDFRFPRSLLMRADETIE